MAQIMSQVFPFCSLLLFVIPTGQTHTRNGGLGYKGSPCLGNHTFALLEERLDYKLGVAFMLGVNKTFSTFF